MFSPGKYNLSRVCQDTIKLTDSFMNLSELQDLQRAFQRHLYHPDTDSIFSHIQSNSRLSASKRITLYRDSIFGRLQKALAAIYPVCKRLVGDVFFRNMIHIYIQENVSHFADLNDYGKSLCQFIKNFEQVNCLPYLSDVAKLEWAWHRLFGVNDVVEFDFEKLRGCADDLQDNIIFMLPHRSSLLASPYPIHQIWNNNQLDSPNEEPIFLQSNQPFYFLVWRKADNHIDTLSQTEWQILTWIQEGLALQELIQKISVQFSSLTVEQILPEWIQKGWLVDFNI